MIIREIVNPNLPDGNPHLEAVTEKLLWDHCVGGEVDDSVTWNKFRTKMEFLLICHGIRIIEVHNLDGTTELRELLTGPEGVPLP